MVGNDGEWGCRPFRNVRKTSNEVARPGDAHIDTHRGRAESEGC